MPGDAVTAARDTSEPDLASQPDEPATAPPPSASWWSRIPALLHHHWLMTALLVAGLALRVLSKVAYQPALIYVDTLKYLYGVYPGSDPAGYQAVLNFLTPFRGLAGVAVVQSLLDAAVNGSLVALTRSLTAVTTLDRSVGEVAARCQNVVALQTLLAGIPLPSSGGLETGGGGVGDTAAAGGVGGRRSLLQPLLEQLDTTSLQTLFFRSVAAGLEPRVVQVVARGGANARILRGAKDRVRSALRACVERGLAVGVGGEQQAVDFEVLVMVGAAAALGR